MRLRVSRPSPAAGLALFGGFLVALSMPPWGWWPLAFLGIAALESSLGATPSRRQRFARGWLFGAGWMYMGMGWMWFLTAPGYIVAGALFATLHGLAALIAPTGPWRAIGRPAAHTVVEAIRLYVPFGGVPLATLPIGQAGGPLLGVVRVGGVVMLTWVVLQIGFALAGPSPWVPQMVRRARPEARPERQGLLGVGVALLIVVVAAVAPDGRAGQQAPLSVAIVQGGGEQGTRAINTSSRLVTERHLEATLQIEPGSVDLVVWPENVVDIDDDPDTATVESFADSVELQEIAAQATRIGAPILVGITEDAVGEDGDEGFLNAQVVVLPDGTVFSRYEKVQRVPFGEYMPMRGVLTALGAPTDLVPRDAVAGRDPATLELPDGTRMSVVISWEVFFGRRAAAGVDPGGTFIVNPTNGSSYTGTVLQTQQVASSRLRAVEFGRDVVQAAPTGFSALIDADGTVRQRTSVSEQAVVIGTITPATGRTLYSRIGDAPVILLALLAFAASWHSPGRAALTARRGPRQAPPASP